MAAGFNPEGGTRNYSFSTYDSHSELCNCISLSRGIRKPKWGYYLRAESFYNVATQEDEYSKGPGGRPEHFHEKSHGESFYRVAESQFKGNGLYFLDEPEAALSSQRQLALLRIICLCAKRGAQFFVVTHSPILLGMPYAEIIGFSEKGVGIMSYEATESYQVTKLFLNQRESYRITQVAGMCDLKNCRRKKQQQKLCWQSLKTARSRKQSFACCSKISGVRPWIRVGVITIEIPFWRWQKLTSPL